MRHSNKTAHVGGSTKLRTARSLRYSQGPSQEEPHLPRVDFSTPRLFVDQDLAGRRFAALDSDQTHYLATVLRMTTGARLLVFNGREGEFAAELEITGKRAARIALRERTRPLPPANDLTYWFAPLKHARLDYMAQKAVEMGVSALRPVRTRRTQSARVNMERLAANAREAAEQCGVLRVPRIEAETSLDDALSAASPERLLIFCDEDADHADPLAALRTAKAEHGATLLIGPEGGFDGTERRDILGARNVLRLSLGPRILRADTAAVAALALIQAAIGDWRGGAP